MARSKGASKLWRPAEIGNAIAVRKLSFKARRGRGRSVLVTIGQPVRQPGATSREPWWCPFEISGLGRPELSSAAGEDSVQAMVLALRAIEAALLVRAKHAGGTVDWLGELERPIFAHTFFVEAYEAAIANLVEGLKLAHELIERPGGSARFEEVTETLRKLTDQRGFLKAARRLRPSRRRAGQKSR